MNFDVNRTKLNNSQIKISIGSSMSLICFLGAIGYFVYEGFGGFFGICILCVLFGFLMILALIPYIGVLIQVSLAYFVIMPWVFSFTSIYPTWLTLLILIICGILGGIITFLMTMVFQCHK